MRRPGQLIIVQRHQQTLYKTLRHANRGAAEVIFDRRQGERRRSGVYPAPSDARPTGAARYCRTSAPAGPICGISSFRDAVGRAGAPPSLSLEKAPGHPVAGPRR